MKKLVKTMEGLPWIIKLLLVIFIDFYGNLYRLFKSISKGNVLGGVLAVILLCTVGLGIFWIIDIITVIISNKIWWID